MTAREKAIEAAARGIALGQTGSPDEAPGYRLDAESAVRNAAPHIESALLDRIEEAVRTMADRADRRAEVRLKQFQREQDNGRYSLAGSKYRSSQRFKHEGTAHREVLTVLSQIRAETQTAARGEAT